MTKKRDNKTKKRNVPDSSDTISIDGSTAPHGFTARGRIHLGGSPMETFSNRAISPTVTGQPVTRHRSSWHWSTRHRSTSHWSPVTSQPSSSQSGTSHLDTSQYLPGFSHRSVNMEYQALGTGYQSPSTGQFITYQYSWVIQPPVVGLQSSYPASISSHHSRSSEGRLPSNDNMGSEHAFAYELPNPATSSRMILPLDFMSFYLKERDVICFLSS